MVARVLPRPRGTKKRRPRLATVREVPCGSVDLTFSAEDDAFRAECRAWLEANVPRGLPSGDTREGFAAHLEWERALFDAQFAVVSWPEAYGGRDASPMQW